ncbi:hypothetical protein [Anaerocolumna sp. AGMB13020]
MYVVVSLLKIAKIKNIIHAFDMDA